MKKKMFGLLTIAAIALTAGWNVMESDVSLSDLALSNVEALARGEAGPDWDHHKSVMTDNGRCCEKYWPNYSCSGAYQSCGY